MGTAPAERRKPGNTSGDGRNSSSSLQEQRFFQLYYYIRRELDLLRQHNTKRTMVRRRWHSKTHYETGYTRQKGDALCLVEQQRLSVVWSPEFGSNGYGGHLRKSIKPRGSSTASSRCRNDVDKIPPRQRSSTCCENHLGKNWGIGVRNSCLIRLTAQTWLHPMTICSGQCSTPWPRENSKTAKKSNSGCPTTLSCSRPSSSEEESILCVNVDNKSSIVMENIFLIDLV